MAGICVFVTLRFLERSGKAQVSAEHPVQKCVLRRKLGPMIIKIAVAGIIGTAIMTAAMYLIAYATKERFKVVKVLGTMLTFQTTPHKGLSNAASAIAVGIIAHYMVGIGFTFIYEWLWSERIINPNLLNASWMGFINGIVGALGWKLFFAIHPNPPGLPLSSYLIAITFGHVFFACGMLVSFLIMGI